MNKFGNFFRAAEELRARVVYGADIEIMADDEKNLEVLRYSSATDSTLGLLFENGAHGREFLAYTLEDEFREEKVSAETRIPEGTYDVKLRTVGGFHSRYLDKFGADFHKGMLHVQDVPGFEYILPGYLVQDRGARTIPPCS